MMERPRLHFWTLEQSILGCGKKTRTNSSLAELTTWAGQKYAPNEVPSLTWRTELAVVYSTSVYPNTEREVEVLLRTLGHYTPDMYFASGSIVFGIPSAKVPTYPCKHKPELKRHMRFVDSRFGLFYTWDPSQRLTKGVMYGDISVPRCFGMMYYVLQSMQYQNSMRTHPMMLGLAALGAATHTLRPWLGGQFSALDSEQLKTGRHDFASRRRDYDLTGIDLNAISSKVCGLAVAICSSATDLRMLVQLSEYLVAECESAIEHNYNSTLKSSALLGSCNASKAQLCSAARLLKLRLDAMLCEAQAYQWKAEIVVQTVFTLTTQRDQEISIEIARDSKTLAQQATRDSTSMKAIAAVTMFFLPGTFVSVSSSSSEDHPRQKPVC